MGVSRRGLIITSGLLGATAGVGGWALLANLRLVPGRGVVDDVLGRCDLTAPAPHEAEPGRLVRSSFYSTHRRRTVGYLLAYPPRAAFGARLPVCLVLHGYGGTASDAFDDIGYHRLLAGAVLNSASRRASPGTSARVPPFVMASVDGGDRYWHPRDDGDDPLGMLLHDFPVVLAQHGLPTDRFALLGWSMGGFGALLAATRAPERFVAVVANAPALWASYSDASDASPAAFDSADDWAQWGDLADHTDALRDMAVRVDCGESDSFAPAVADLRGRLPDPSVVHFGKGCHDIAFWRSVAPEQLRLIGTALRGRNRT